MREGKKQSRLVFAEKPLNRRTARVPAASSSNPVLQQRALKVQSRSRLGLGFAASLEDLAPATQGRGRLPATVVTALVTSVVLAPLAVLSSGVLLPAALGTGSLAAAATAWWLRSRGSKASTVGVAPVAVPIDTEALLRLDRMMEAVAPELPEDIFQQLLSLKGALVGAAQVCTGELGAESLSMDDRLYVVECLRRYLPDSIGAFMAIPVGQREAVIDEKRSAIEVFVDQLALLQSDIGVLMQKAHRNSGDKLIQQQRFLETKRRGP